MRTIAHARSATFWQRLWRPAQHVGPRGRGPPAGLADFPIATIARVLGVSPSGYCVWRSRPASTQATTGAVLLRRISTIHTELQAEGTAVARKRVARLMRGAGLRGVSRRRFPTTTQCEPGHRCANDLVGRDFRAAGPNRLWVADITYAPTAAGFLFLAVVLDVWSRSAWRRRPGSPPT